MSTSLLWGTSEPTTVLNLRIAGVQMPTPRLVVIPPIALGLLPAGTMLSIFWDQLAPRDVNTVLTSGYTSAWIGLQTPDGWSPQFLASVTPTLTASSADRGNAYGRLGLFGAMGLFGGTNTTTYVASMTIQPLSALRILPLKMPAQFY